MAKRLLEQRQEHGLDVKAYLKTLWKPETKKSAVIGWIFAWIVITMFMAFGVYVILGVVL